MITINKKEIEKFSQLAEEWWNPNGKFAPLHKFNPVRIDFVREKLLSYFKLNSDSNEPLKKEVLVATPSKPALETMLTCLGFSNFQYFDWKKNIKNFRSLVDYYHGKRVTLVASLSEN